MSETSASPQSSLRSVLRSAPLLAPEDSLRRCLQVSRFQPLLSLPVVENGRLRGMVALSDLLPLLAEEAGEGRDSRLDAPVAGIMQAPIVTASPEMTTDAIGRLCALHRLSEVPVVDDRGYYLGMVSAADLLLPDAPMPRPARIGGMATPFGVYLTDGTVRAGANDFALVTTGVMMTLLYSSSYLIVLGAGMLLNRFAHLPNPHLLDPDYAPPASQPLMGLVSVGLSVVVLALFMLLMRASRLAGFHAAEHQTVHAVERGENLLPTIVQRMPRPHPRCGTNLVAAVMVFSTLSQAFAYIPALDGGIAQIAAILATLFTWRSVGTFLQERFTTRPATDRELRSGIAAGQELLNRFVSSPPSRPTVLQRVWFSGMIQVMSGMGLTYAVYYLGWLVWKRFVGTV